MEGNTLKILVTGGTGTISSGIVAAAIRRGDEVYTLNRGRHNERALPGVKNIVCNIWDVGETKRKLQGLYFDVVVECLVYDVRHLEMSLDYFSGNCKQYVFISTADVYDRTDNTCGITEINSKNNVGWKYPVNKIACENYLKQFGKEHNLIYTIIRPPVVYGNYRVPFPVINKANPYSLLERIKKGKPMISLEDNNTIFTIIHISDFSRIAVGLFGNEKAYNEDFHIGNSSCYHSWDEIIATASEILNKDVPIIHVPFEVFRKKWRDIYPEIRYNKSISLKLNDEKVKGVSDNYGIQTDLEKGIRNIVDYSATQSSSMALKTDNEWDGMCDTVLYYCYQKKLLCENEMNELDAYFSQMGKEGIVSIKTEARKYRWNNFCQQNRYANKLIREMKRIGCFAQKDKRM